MGDVVGVNNGNEIIYEEKIFAHGITAVLTAATVLIILVWLFQVLLGITTILPFINWLFLFLTLLLIGLTLNFRKLEIRMTPKFIYVGFGIFRHQIPWKYVENCSIDEPSFLKYGGLGLRIRHVGGKWRIIYNAIWSPLVVLSLNDGRIKEFGFSTNKPEEVLFLVKQQIRSIKP
ncbi:MAG: hypothetical protein QW620_06400 [Thermoplasmata archaeon]